MLKVPDSKHSLPAGYFSKTLSVHPAVNGDLTLFRPGEGEGGVEEEWHPTSVTALSVQVGSPNSHFHQKDDWQLE